MSNSTPGAVLLKDVLSKKMETPLVHYVYEGETTPFYYDKTIIVDVPKNAANQESVSKHSTPQLKATSYCPSFQIVKSDCSVGEDGLLVIEGIFTDEVVESSEKRNKLEIEEEVYKKLSDKELIHLFQSRNHYLQLVASGSSQDLNKSFQSLAKSQMNENTQNSDQKPKPTTSPYRDKTTKVRSDELYRKPASPYRVNETGFGDYFELKVSN